MKLQHSDEGRVKRWAGDRAGAAQTDESLLTHPCVLFEKLHTCVTSTMTCAYYSIHCATADGTVH